MQNIPQVKLGIVAVSRDCFPIELSQKRRGAILTACAAKGLDVYEAKTTVENEKDMLAEVEEVKRVLREEMEQVVQYSVPLTTEVGTGKTWLEAH